MPTEKEREAVKKAYDSPDWRRKVDKMPDPQVFAVYKRLVLQGRIKV